MVFIQVKYSKFNLFWEMSVQGPPSQCAIASSLLDNGRAFATPSQCTVASYPPAFVIWDFASFHNHLL